jgi:hypothetical protein
MSRGSGIREQLLLCLAPDLADVSRSVPVDSWFYVLGEVALLSGLHRAGKSRRSREVRIEVPFDMPSR